MYNHTIEEYKSNVHELKNKCKKIEAQSSHGSLSQIFDGETRMHPFACEISVNECEFAMYR